MHLSLLSHSHVSITFYCSCMQKVMTPDFCLIEVIVEVFFFFFTNYTFLASKDETKRFFYIHIELKCNMY